MLSWAVFADELQEHDISIRYEISHRSWIVDPYRRILDFPPPCRSSYGVIAVRNSALRINGLSVSSWHDLLDPERLRIDIVEAFKTCILDSAL